MSIQVIQTGFEGLLIVELKVHGDERGFFVERFNTQEFAAQGLPTKFVQDNHSRSASGVLRGLHYQTKPAQGKLVGAIRGSIWDVVVDIRKQSATFGKSFVVELSDVNGRLLWVPPGFAHGFCVLGEAGSVADVFYKVTELYEPKTEGGIRWDDPDLNIQWPVQNPLVSARDRQLQSFAEYRQRSVSN